MFSLYSEAGTGVIFLSYETGKISHRQEQLSIAQCAKYKKGELNEAFCWNQTGHFVLQLQAPIKVDLRVRKLCACKALRSKCYIGCNCLQMIVYSQCHVAHFAWKHNTSHLARAAVRVEGSTKKVKKSTVRRKVIIESDFGVDKSKEIYSHQKLRVSFRWYVLTNSGAFFCRETVATKGSPLSASAARSGTETSFSSIS